MHKVFIRNDCGILLLGDTHFIRGIWHLPQLGVFVCDALAAAIAVVRVTRLAICACCPGGGPCVTGCCPLDLFCCFKCGLLLM